MLKLWWRLSVIGLIGAASILLMLPSMERMVPVKLDPFLFGLAATAQPALLVLALAALGAWAAPKIGLDAPAVRAWSEHRPVLPVLARQLPAAAAAGLAVAVVLIAYTAIIRPTDEGAALLRFDVPLPTRILYGGVVEELLLRWGLMSFLGWLVWSVAGRPERLSAWTFWAAIVCAAGLFASGHLPALFFLLPHPPTWLVALALAANFVPGVFFGWLFWRQGLEAAMMAHALAHLFAWAALMVL